VSDRWINRFGRRGGRGFRPWILLPKVLALGLYTGSVAAALLLWLTSGHDALPVGDPRRLLAINTVSRLVFALAIPALLMTLLLGVGLLLQHWRAFLRMRWMRIKLLSIMVLVPLSHALASSRLSRLREAFAQRADDDAASRQFALALAVALLAAAWVIVLGRLKPRLGQNPAHSYHPAPPTQ
jgi:uncharacterized membrane protein